MTVRSIPIKKTMYPNELRVPLDILNVLPVLGTFLQEQPAE